VEQRTENRESRVDEIVHRILCIMNQVGWEKGCREKGCRERGRRKERRWRGLSRGSLIQNIKSCFIHVVT
jgi:hypothetical protein